MELYVLQYGREAGLLIFFKTTFVFHGIIIVNLFCSSFLLCLSGVFANELFFLIYSFCETPILAVYYLVANLKEFIEWQFFLSKYYSLGFHTYYFLIDEFGVKTPMGRNKQQTSNTKLLLILF